VERRSFDFVTPYPDLILLPFRLHAKSKNVKMIMHHETSGSVANYERHLDRAFDYEKYDYPAVKTGYVGKIIPRGEFHDGQTMVNHFNFVARRAADYKLMVNSHESSRPPGYKNLSNNALPKPPEEMSSMLGVLEIHLCMKRFYHLQDFWVAQWITHYFEIKMSYYDKNKTEQVHTTLARWHYTQPYSQSRWRLICLKSTKRNTGCFSVYQDNSCRWDESIYLQAEPGDYLTIARKAKGEKESWFLGAITDENARKREVTLY
jgi:hypothetical protein